MKNEKTNANEFGTVENNVAANAASKNETRLVQCEELPRYVANKTDGLISDELELIIDVGTIIDHKSMGRTNFYVKKTGNKVIGAIAVIEAELKRDLNAELLLSLERRLGAKVGVNCTGYDGKYLILRVVW